jgi:hypothetical protein
MIRAPSLGRLATGAAGLLAVLLPLTAHGYVRYRATAPKNGGLGTPYSWGVRHVDIVGYPDGLPGMTVQQISDAMTAAVSAWSADDPANADHSFLGLSISIEPATTPPPDAANDNKNTIAIRTGVWTDICSTLKDGTKDCHQPGELALTTVWSRACGEVVEADVEVNADGASAAPFMWADLDATVTNGFHDLQNALTHEMGHFIGLDHTCWLNAGAAVGEVDDQGNAVPDCSDATPAEVDATMYPSSDAGDISKRTLSQDDLDGLWAIYPAGTNPVTCGTLRSGGCTMVPGDDGAITAGVAARGICLLSGALVLGARFLRRSRRRR